MPIRIPVKADPNLRTAFEDVELRLQEIERGLGNDGQSMELQQLAEEVRRLNKKIDDQAGNDDVDTNDELLSSAYSVRLEKSSVHEIPNNSNTEVIWETEVYDNGGFFDSGSSTTDLVIPVAGTYLITAGFRYDTITAEARNSAQIFIDDSVASVSECMTTAAVAGFIGHQLIWMGALNAAQVVNIMAFQISGGAVDIRTQEAFVAIKRIGTD